MLKAVLFDWFTTLADYAPARYELYCQAFKEQGIDIPPDKAIRGVLRGDEYVYSEHLKSSLAQRSPEERLKVYLAFPTMILDECCIQASDEMVCKVRDRMRELFKPEEVKFVLFDDVLPTLRKLKARGLVMGVITNLRDDMNSVYKRLNLGEYLSFILTQEEAKAAKPNPAIFQAALTKAGVSPDEAIYVGDQHQLDVVGARAAGIKPILIDRCNLYPHIKDCTRIRSLSELEKYLE
ncbi:MAG: HAD-IA family hydrolase [Chloroflexota bacterium]